MEWRPHFSEAMRQAWAAESRDVEPGETSRQLAVAQLAAADGNMLDARDTLQRVISRLDLPHLPRGSWLPLCLASVYCNDFATLSSVLTGVAGAGLAVKFGLQDQGTSPRNQNTFIGKIHDLSELTFDMPLSAYASPHLPFLLSRAISTLPLFARHLQLGSRQNVTIALNVGDFGRVPGLAFCSNSEDYSLIPDPEFLQSEGYKVIRQQFLGEPVPWEARRKIAFWRGATTGQPTSQGIGWRSLPRARLCQIARDEHSGFFDIGISRIELPPNHVGWNEIPQSGLMQPPVPMARFQEFLYHVDIDGHTNAWGGLFQKLLTGSPVLKIGSSGGWRQWYYDRLEPWQHFVPVKSDMSDLAANVRWLMQNDDAARDIGNAGQAVARSLDYQSQIEIGAKVIQKVAGIETSPHSAVQHG